jgi:hypothetical protein
MPPTLADDLTELGDNATASLVRQAIERFNAWKFEVGEELSSERSKSGASTKTGRLGRLASILAHWQSHKPAR